MSETEFREHIERLKTGYHEVLKLKTEETLDRLDTAVWFGNVQPVESEPVLAVHFANCPPDFKLCFRNCQGFVAADRTDYATYCEGFVSSPGGAMVHHGWLVVGGTVYDPTLELSAPMVAMLRESVAGRGYFGVQFSTADVIQNFQERQGKPFLLLPGITT